MHRVGDVHIEHVHFDKRRYIIRFAEQFDFVTHDIEHAAGGVLNIVRHEIELLCKPDDIPPFIEVDVLNVDITHSVHINDVKLPSNVKTAIKDRNFTIVTIAGRSKEEEIPTAAPTAAVPGVAGAAPAAGAAPGAPGAAPAVPGAAPAAPGAAPAAGAAPAKKK